MFDLLGTTIAKLSPAKRNFSGLKQKERTC
jgi:hypothetical protein